MCWIQHHRTVHGKDEQMEPRIVATSKLLVDHEWNVGHAGRRKYTAAELDAIADFSWPWDGLRRVIAAGMHALRSRQQDRQPPVMPGITRPQTISR